MEKSERLDIQYMDKIINGDCREVLKHFRDNSIDLIVTSPPYADNRKNGYVGIPTDRYIEWFLPISRELLRVLKPDGSFILNVKERVINGERGTYIYELILKMREQGWIWTEEYIWHKKNTHPGFWPNRLRDLWEHVYHFTKSKNFKMFQNEVKVPIGEWAEKRLASLGKNDAIRFNSRTNSGFGKNIANWLGKEYVLPGNVLYLATESSNKNHSATFPVDLPLWFIKLLSKEGDLVLDPFMGSGTTAVASIRSNRHYVGIEINKTFCEVAAERIEEEIRKTTLNVIQLEDRVKGMNEITLDEVRAFVEQHIGDFHESRLETLKKSDLEVLLKGKNPYLFRAKGVETAQELVESLLDAKLSSSEETIMGGFLEELAIFVIGKTAGGQKSGIPGVDFEYTLSGKRYLFSMKSSLKWGNAGQWKDLEKSLQTAIKVINQSSQTQNVECYLGVSYGKAKRTLKRGIINQVCGQEFWYMISGRLDFYKEIVEPIGYRAKEQNESFNDEKTKIVNSLTKKIVIDFMDEEGNLRWDEIAKFNSGNLEGTLI